jgi:hypothetical protein
LDQYDRLCHSLFLTVVRLFNDFSCTIGDITSFNNGPVTFAIVAATCVLGSQFVILANSRLLGLLLLLLGLLTWTVLIYAFLMKVIIAETKPTLGDPNQFKEVIADLKRLKYIDTKEGRGGGCWLSDSGRRRAEKL